MTSARLAAIAIVLFCGTMTALLVRAVYWPEESRLSAIAPQVPIELFLQRLEGTPLDIWEANKITGNLYLNPYGLTLRKDGAKGGMIRVEATVLLKQAVMGTQILGVQGSCFLAATGEVDDFDLNFKLLCQPEINLKVHQPVGEKWPSVQLVRGDVILFKSIGGHTADDANIYLVNMITSAAGFSPDAWTDKGPPVPVAVRAGRISAGNEAVDGYYIAPGGEGGQSFRVYMANTGEILRIETPFSKGSELGLRFLSQALRPPGTEVPSLQLYGTPAIKRRP